ncbi:MULTISPECIES: C40 family peptidase [Bacillus]|uniref:C40 family peptidase n=1 Tax=Bacillus TaxID=1386 RepID=UPI0002DDD1B6|nr:MULTISPECIES: C40 family peptidase [Bacillus]
MSLKITLHAGNKTTDITPITSSVLWRGNVAECGRTCEISLKNTINSETKLVSGIENGLEIRCHKNSKEFFRGVIFTYDIANDGSMKLSVRDYNAYLTKNSDSKVFRKKKASQIVQELCKQYGIAVGKIDDTGYVLPKLILRDKTLYDMITIALTETRKKTGKIFLLDNELGKLTLREYKKQAVELIIADKYNLLSANYSESIEDLRNSIRITGKSGEDAKGVTVSDSATIKKYGRMQEKQHESEKSDAELKPIAQALLKELNSVKKESNVDAIGDTSVRSGRVVRVYEAMTGLKAGYYVSADDHSFEVNGTHRMSLTLSRSLDVAEMKYEEPSENSSGSNSSGSKSASGNSKADKVVSLARSYKGKLTYSFGNTNIPKGVGDCSGFTKFIYQQAAGINIGSGTISQVTKGTKVSTADAQAGDLVLFQGTYRKGVSHVGIVTRKGYCVSLANSGCKEHSYTSGYWGGHFMQVRRVL